MILPKSNLKFVDFFVLKNSITFHDPVEPVTIKQVFEGYEIDIDFGKREDVSDKSNIAFQIFIKSEINSGKNMLAGYEITTEGVGIFHLMVDNLMTEDDINSLKDYSALSITINALRNYISEITAHGPFGKYVLPAVQVNELINMKVAAQTGEVNDESSQ